MNNPDDQKQKKLATWSFGLGILAVVLIALATYDWQTNLSSTKQVVANSIATKKDFAQVYERTSVTTKKIQGVGNILEDHNGKLEDQDLVIKKELPKVSANLANTNQQISKLNKEISEMAKQDSIRSTSEARKYGI